MRLGCEVDDRVHRADLVDVLPHGDVAAAAVRTLRQVPGIPGIGELVEDDDVLACSQHPFDEVRADEARAAGDEKAHRITV